MPNIATSFSTATADVSATVKRIRLPTLLGWQDVKQRYRRSIIGPFWLTISTAILVSCIGLIFGHLFKAPMKEFLPFLASGLVIWTFMSSTITEGCTAFTSADHIIKQLPIPLTVHVARVVWRNAIILAHNIVIIPIAMLFLGREFSLTAVLSLLGFVLVTLNLMWVSLLLGTICTRYRDFPQMVASLMQVMFYTTPIMWMPRLLPQEVARYFLTYNPFYHLMELMRAPLLGTVPDKTHWFVALGLLAVGWPVTLLFFGKFHRRIAYWL